MGFFPTNLWNIGRSLTIIKYWNIWVLNFFHLKPPQRENHLHTDLHPVGFPEADADARGESSSRHTADHRRHAPPTGAVALQLDFSAQFTIREVGLIARAVYPETPVVFLPALGQQPEEEQQNSGERFLVGGASQSGASTLRCVLSKCLNWVDVFLWRTMEVLVKFN